MSLVTVIISTAVFAFALNKHMAAHERCPETLLAFFGALVSRSHACKDNRPSAHCPIGGLIGGTASGVQPSSSDSDCRKSPMRSILSKVVITIPSLFASSISLVITSELVLPQTTTTRQRLSISDAMCMQSLCSEGTLLFTN